MEDCYLDTRADVTSPRPTDAIIASKRRHLSECAITPNVPACPPEGRKLGRHGTAMKQFPPTLPPFKPSQSLSGLRLDAPQHGTPPHQVNTVAAVAVTANIYGYKPS